MCKFALIKIEAINGKQVFEKLLKDDVCQFDEFEKEIKEESKYLSELSMIFLYMESVANLIFPPETKFKDITPSNEAVKEYEFKTKHLRVYVIKKENGKIVVFGGYKNNQKKDLRKFRSIKEMYLNEQKLRKNGKG